MGDVVVLKVAGAEPKGNGAREALIRYTEENFQLEPERAGHFVDHLLMYLFIEGFVVVPTAEGEAP